MLFCASLDVQIIFEHIATRYGSLAKQHARFFSIKMSRQ
jgi:hypothetical protein